MISGLLIAHFNGIIDRNGELKLGKVDVRLCPSDPQRKLKERRLFILENLWSLNCENRILFIDFKLNGRIEAGRLGKDEIKDPTFNGLQRDKFLLINEFLLKVNFIQFRLKIKRMVFCSRLRGEMKAKATAKREFHMVSDFDFEINNFLLLESMDCFLTTPVHEEACRALYWALAGQGVRFRLYLRLFTGD